METVHCETLEELRATIERYGPGVIYRGQVHHFSRPDGSPALSTSFQRRGCIPDLMIKWIYYAKRALKHLVHGWQSTGDLATDQAILQHYGWRSFFLDASGDARVAAWFASHRFESSFVVNMVEDCFEDPVWLRAHQARFTAAQGNGNLYLISQKLLRQHDIQAVHLSEIATRDGAPRYVRQDAYMVGPLIDGALNGDCVLCHITAPTEILRAFGEGLSTSWLFPEPSDDPVFRELLAMPWEKMRHAPDDVLEAFSRALELPEYSSHVQKHMPARCAMYRPFWTRDLTPPSGHQSAIAKDVTHILCGSALYHGSSLPRYSLPQINKLLAACEELAIEFDGLVYHGMGSRYGKGIGVVKMTSDIVCVFEYGVDHPGLRIANVGRFPGLHYQIDDVGVWRRVPHVEDCDCGSEHVESFSLLGRVDESLDDGWVKCIEPHLYIQDGIDPTSDKKAIWHNARQGKQRTKGDGGN